MTRIEFSTKADTLQRLESLISTARILPMFRLNYGAWQDPAELLDQVSALDWCDSPLIVRSTSRHEDTLTGSGAGHFTSVPHVLGRDSIQAAINRVFASYGTPAADDEVFIQPMLQAAAVGVLFTSDPSTGAPYYIANIDHSGRADAVTSGDTNELQTVIRHRSAGDNDEQRINALAALGGELIDLFDDTDLDIEFGFDQSDTLYLFQVRHLIVQRSYDLAPERHLEFLNAVGAKVERSTAEHPFLLGKTSVLGVMPDWNPAEIIGVRPRPLAYSLYRELVTDAVWAYQRSTYGYRNLRSFPLLQSLHGLPYVDVRISCNSFIPADLDDDLGSKLVDYYIQKLTDEPTLHDKIEFDVIYSCYTPDLVDRLRVLGDHGLSDDDQQQIADSLRTLTRNVLNPHTGFWRGDLLRLEKLQPRRERLLASDQDAVSKIYWLLEDCKRYGTLPFAGLARGAFIAVQFLHSLVACGAIEETVPDRFLESVDTVNGKMARDFQSLDRDAFLSAYGHLRPGTYDILSPRYDEEPDLYFNWDRSEEPIPTPVTSFSLTGEQQAAIDRLLQEHGLDINATMLFDFMRQCIEGREFAKFQFTWNLSEALRILRQLGADNGLSLEDISYASIRAVYESYTTSASVRDQLVDSILIGKETYAATQQLILPPLITSAANIYSFQLPNSKPNFVTTKSVRAKVSSPDMRDSLAGSIVMITNADPGFDWLFSHNIGGMITAYGGANSHMAIRAAELGLPAVIGAGEKLFAIWRQAEVLDMDCANQQVLVVR